MNKDRVVGTMNDVMGSAKRKVGNMTGNNSLKIEGAVQQVKGKVQNTLGKVKDSAHDAQVKLNASPKTEVRVAPAPRKVVVVRENVIM